MFESLDDSESKVRVELYIENVSIGKGQNSANMVQCSKVGEGSETTSTTHGSENVPWGSGCVSSGSSSRAWSISGTSSEGNLRGSTEFIDDDIPYYRSFDGSSMVASYPEHGMQKDSEPHNPEALAKGMMFESKEQLPSAIKKVYIENHQEIKVMKSDSMRWGVACKQNTRGC
ncbi:hypothetical protein POM88_041626 [Heracleum sosnowskyi]|uniref:Transposase MuDR plant domain-containing protein n=1 Tax=Heracleum sosnowskyi TaxID=360622 RepID=A0AAD8HEL8_9APIA|nr:hypothetical protein POM88_041626 [Heracleum sosnowskyi]